MTNARRYEVEEALRNGVKVSIRAVRPDDRERIAEAFAGLERESVYTRFFSYKRELSSKELEQLDSMDFVRDVMLVVTTRVDTREIVIASASYVAREDRRGRLIAEIAFAVEEDYQGLGIASRLLRHLIAIARSNHIAGLEADVLVENKAMLAVFARSGLPMQRRREGGVVHLEFDLNAKA